MKKIIVLLIFCLSILNAFSQIDILDASKCVFSYGTGAAGGSGLIFSKIGDGMNANHFKIINDSTTFQTVTGLKETPLPYFKSIKMMSQKNYKAAKISFPIDLSSGDVVVIYWSGWIEKPGHSIYEDGGLTINLKDEKNNDICSGLYFANGYMENKDVWTTIESYIYTSKWQRLLIDTKSLKNNGKTNVTVDFTAYGCLHGGHECCIWISLGKEESYGIKQLFCDNSLTLTAIEGKSYKWYKDNDYIDNKQTITVTEKGEYKVVVEPNLGCTTEYYATVKDDPKNKKIIAIARKDSAICGDSIAVDIYEVANGDSTIIETIFVYNNNQKIVFENEEYCEVELSVNVKFYSQPCPDCPEYIFPWWWIALAGILGFILGCLICRLLRRPKLNIYLTDKNNNIIKKIINGKNYETKNEDFIQ